MVNNNKAYQVARYAIMLAIIFVATLLDRVITLGLPIAGASVELLVTFTLCFLFNSWIDGFLASAFMGLSSFILAFPFGKVASQNPLISIVPRLFVTIIAFCVYRLILLLTSKMKNRILAQTVAMVPATFVGLVTNTILYMGALTLFTDAYGSLVAALQAVAILNVLPEYLVSFIGVAPLVLGVRRGLKLGRDGNNWKTAKEPPAQSDVTADGVDVNGESAQVLQNATDGATSANEPETEKTCGVNADTAEQNTENSHGENK